MSYSWQHQLISRIIRSGNIGSITQWGISADDFTMGETRGYFTQIQAYYAAAETSGSVWGPQALMQKFPHFMLCDDLSMTTDALCVEVRMDKVRLQARQLIAQAEELIDVDPVKAVNTLQETAAVLRNDCTSTKVDVHIADGLSRVWDNYCAAARGDKVSVYAWPWEPLQSATLGVRSTDYIILYGRPKSMKSWILCYMVAHMITQDINLKILIYSKEMSADEIFERVGCLLSGIDYGNFVSGRMTPEERDSFLGTFSMMQSLVNRMTVVCLSAQDVKYGQDTVAWLESKIERYSPDAVFVDGMYLMSDAHNSKNNHERVANISRAMRQLVLRRSIPVVATVQANRNAAKNEEANTEEVAFSDSLGQDATMLIRIVNEWKKNQNTLALVMGGATRRYKLNGFRVYGMPATNFGYYGELSDKETQLVVRSDDTPAEANVKRAAKAKKTEDAAKDAAADIASMVKNA